MNFSCAFYLHFSFATGRFFIMAQPASFDHYSEGLLTWVQGRLNSLIGADDFAPLMLALSDSELLEYCRNLLGDNSATNDFVSTLISKRNQEKSRRKIALRKDLKEQCKQSRKPGKGRKSNSKRDMKGTMTLDSDLFGPTTKKRRVRTDVHPASSTKNVVKNAKKGGSMTITHAPISQKGARSAKKKKKRMFSIIANCQYLSDGLMALSFYSFTPRKSTSLWLSGHAPRCIQELH